jgi:hypothetical protein
VLEYPIRVWGSPRVITVSPLCNGPGPATQVYLIDCPTPVRVRVSNIFVYLMHLPFLIFQATDTRDALAKSVYASLFEWLVEQINKSLSVGKRRTGRSISILDIYGFESFDVMYFSLPKVVIY